MEQPVLNQAHSENALIKADKRNVKRGAIVLLILGIALLVFNIVLIKGETEFFWIYVLPVIYILTSIIGLYSVSSNSKSGTVLYSALLTALIIINILASILSLIIFIYLLVSPPDCDSTKSDSCGLAEALILIIMILSFVSFIISGALAFLLFVFLRNVRKLNSGRSGFQMAEL